MGDSTQLLAMQRAFMAALRTPLTCESRAKSALPETKVGVSGEFVRFAEDILTPSTTLTAVERLELYHRQYWYRLLDSMAEDFPALRTLLGDADFWRLLEAYLEATPSRGPLSQLGSGLADFIGKEAGPRRVLAQDLARIEYALCLALDAAELPCVLPGQLGQVNLTIQPHVQLLALRTSVDRFWKAWHDEVLTLPKPTRHACFVAVFREGPRTHVERLPRGAFNILTSIRQLHSLEAAMSHVSSDSSLLKPSEIGQISQWFAVWAQRGWLCLSTPSHVRVAEARSEEIARAGSSHRR